MVSGNGPHGLDGQLGSAEAAIDAGRFAEAGKLVESLTSAVAASGDPALLARAAWVAGLCSLARGDTGDFAEMAEVASSALELADADGADGPSELARLAQRIQALVALENAGSVDAAIAAVLRAHLELLRRIDGDPDDERWWLVDIDRADWPAILAAARAHLGRPSHAETILARGGDAISSVVIAVLLGAAGPGTSLDRSTVARLAFAHEDARREALARIDELIAAGVIVEDDGRLGLAAI